MKGGQNTIPWGWRQWMQPNLAQADGCHARAAEHYSLGLGATGCSLIWHAQVAFTAELRRRLPPECGLVAAAVHPGEVLTNVVSSLPGLLQSLYRVVMFPFCLSPAEGAPLILQLQLITPLYCHSTIQ